MKIENSNVVMESSYSYQKKEIKSETLNAWNGNVRITAENGNISEIKKKFIEKDMDKLDISLMAKEMLENSNFKNIDELNETDEIEESGIFEMSEKDKQKLEILKRLLEALTGKKIEYLDSIGDKEEIKKLKKYEQQIEGKENGIKNQGRKPEGWGLIYRKSEITQEKEVVGFNSKGTIRTSDGREISFNINFNLKRESEHGETFELKMGDALIDPLVISFSGNVSELANDKIEFDIDGDGVKDFISFTAAGSGFLALDKNENGEIDDGNELFGPQSGNGFSELKKYDEDGNNWIDENDTVFSKLKVWTTGENGEKTLLAAAEVGVGAIYLGSSSTKFSMLNSDGSLNGEMKISGIYLKESGEAGLIQHIDLKK